MTQTKPPAWFWIVSALLLLWSFSACAAFYAHVSFDPNDPANPAYDRQLYKSLPGWLDYVFAVAVGTILIGAVGLLIRRAWAVPLFALSLLAVMIQFGWTLGMTDLIAVKGFAEAAGVPIVIFAFGCFALWFAQFARARGWIG